MLTTQEIQTLVWSLVKLVPTLLKWRSLSRNEKIEISAKIIEAGTTFAKDIAD